MRLGWSDRCSHRRRPERPNDGDLDVAFEPAGTKRYDVGIQVPVASLDDVIRSKRAANRPKDRASYPSLKRSERRSAGDADLR